MGSEFTPSGTLMQDAREAPTYSAADVSLYAGVPLSTLQYWLSGTKDDPKPLIEPPGEQYERKWLSFANLLEAHILLATRKNNVPLLRIRRGLEYLRSIHPGAAHPLLEYARHFRYAENRRDLFIQIVEGTDPINASRYGQVGFGEVFNRHLHRIEWGKEGPVRLFPIRSDHIVLDVNLCGGRPVVKGTGVLARMIWSRRKAGDSTRRLAKDFRIKVQDVQEAIRFIEAA
jgi:uncharacterized protein (DUF433 family)